ncbi:hypothetical protein OB919_14695 [Halobacteria archaeon AArc-curdl1]|uniref:Uncharacterized protein n=1 Tax=Natronosalvus hydrolyticus TaxID=2979988 RepID=A0AAP2Z9J6_9EURY|nr:hypothetical protein [Halobacteria archaeon AArc-curdl1]
MTSDDSASLVPPVRPTVRRYWNDILSIYYANTPIWRVLKSFGLLFIGFFCWSAGALLLSYRPDWTFLYYVMAYGFVLILWGPLTHFVILPIAIRLRRSAEHPITRTFANKASKINLTVFFTIVIILGTAPISPMLLDFGTIFEDGERQPDVNPDVDCVVLDDLVQCSLSNEAGIDHIVVTSGDRTLERIDEPPYTVEFAVGDLEEVVGQKQFVLELRDENGETIRRYTRSLSMLDEA